jgi:quercetin dioxygenase-like cupin family protein
VLKGSLVMLVRSGNRMTLGPGDTFYGSPHDVHTASRNASATNPARFLVFLVKQTGAPATVPAK